MEKRGAGLVKTTSPSSIRPSFVNVLWFPDNELMEPSSTNIHIDTRVVPVKDVKITLEVGI